MPSSSSSDILKFYPKRRLVEHDYNHTPQALVLARGMVTCYSSCRKINEETSDLSNLFLWKVPNMLKDNQNISGSDHANIKFH